MNELIHIRRLQESDAQILTDAEIAQGWGAGGRLEKYQSHLRDQAAGRCISLVAEYDGEVAGYINLFHRPVNGPFVGQEIPEIVDFGVLEEFRCKGIGTALMDEAERLAAQESDAVCLGVGLYCSYGSAQRMYVKRGYIPDGSGAWYGNQMATPYEEYCLDDDLVLFFRKTLH